MRSNPTEAEQCLWYSLRAQRFMDLKFKRQKPVGPFIVDFMCLRLALGIEVGGIQHGDARDFQRGAWLKQHGFTVLHSWNNDILRDTEAVLEEIRQVVLERLPSPAPSGHPLPQAGEGKNPVIQNIWAAASDGKPERGRKKGKQE